MKLQITNRLIEEGESLERTTMVKNAGVYSAQRIFFLILFFFLSAFMMPFGVKAGSICKVTDDSTIINNDRFQVDKYYDKSSETYYFLTRIKHADGQGRVIKLRLALSNRDTGELVREFAIRENCTLAFNASTAHNTQSKAKRTISRKPTGIQIINRRIVQERPRTLYTLGIRDDNRLVLYKPGTTAQDILNDGGTRDALSGFIPLIEHHRIVPDSLFSLRSNFNKKNPRQIIAQFDNLDILFLSCGGRGFGGRGMTSKEVIRILRKLNVRFAFMLDGGGSVSTVVDGELITEKIDVHGTKERPRPNFLYIK